MAAITDEAEKTLGKAEPGDWLLFPETHAVALPPAAGALQRVLRGPGLPEIIDRYNTYGRKAAAAQKSYKGEAKAAAIATFLAILVGSLFVLPRYEHTLAGATQIAAAIQAVLVAASLGLSLFVGYTKPFEAWMEMRATAENARHDLFDEVMKAGEAPGGLQQGELPLLPLQLEYFRRYQLDVQRNYYRGRGNEHLSASRVAHYWRIAALLILVASMFPILWSLQGKEWMPSFAQGLLNNLPGKTLLAEHIFLGISLVVSGLQGLLAAYAVISLNDRNAARYLATAANLDFLAGRPLAEARERAAAGDRAGVLAFVALVQQEISSEHREWIALRKIAPDLSLDRLATLRLPKLK